MSVESAAISASKGPPNQHPCQIRYITLPPSTATPHHLDMSAKVLVIPNIPFFKVIMPSTPPLPHWKPLNQVSHSFSSVTVPLAGMYWVSLHLLPSSPYLLLNISISRGDSVVEPSNSRSVLGTAPVSEVFTATCDAASLSTFK